MWIHNDCISVKCKFVEQNNSVPIRVVKHSGNGIAVFCTKYDNAVCLLQILTSNRGCYTLPNGVRLVRKTSWYIYKKSCRKNLRILNTLPKKSID